MSEDRRDRFVFKTVKGLTLDRSGGHGPPLLESQPTPPVVKAVSPKLGGPVLRTSEDLAAVVGDVGSRGEVVSKVWAYIKDNNLQNPTNKREILTDQTLEKLFGSKRLTMFEMNARLSRHIFGKDAPLAIKSAK